MISIIPAIDLIDGKCVRLSQGDYSKKTVYREDPLEAAKEFEGAGIRRLHLVDLDGAKAGRIVNSKVLERIAGGTSLEIDFGGGIKTDSDIQSVYDAGATMATIGSLAVKDPALFQTWVHRFGSEKILLGADVKDGKIAIGGWLEQTSIFVQDFVNEKTKLGITNIFCTDISKDGMLKGPATELYRSLLKNNSLPFQLIASGGISSIEDIREVEAAGCAGVIIGKAIYEGRIRLSDLSEFIG